MNNNYSHDPKVMSLMLHLASYVESPYSYESRTMSGLTRIVPDGAAVDGKPTVVIRVSLPPVDGRLRFLGDEGVAPVSTGKSVGESGTAPCLPASEDSTRDKEFMQTPWIKPPRRESFNESDTRGWRRDYQKDYRSEHGNNS